ncbi:MAG: hypothetical protein QOI10_2221, partial [Solirubrobacterales bacterium]|nr:hypothetical protein [Solirubrobacterales bacterium]
SSVKITTLPSAGALKLSATPVTAGDSISAANLTNLTFDPAANGCGASYASFAFQVRDDGGTANGGVDTDQSPNTITIDVSCVNDAPTNISLTNNSVAENTPQGTDVGDLTTTDPDTGQTHTYTLITGAGDTDNNDFQINGQTLEVKNPLDFEAGQTRSVRIRSTDSGSPVQSFEKSLTITVTDVNETPPDADGDGVADANDNCPSASNSNQTNTDSDAQGDACDPDDDNDGIADNADACPAGATGTGNDLDSDGCKDFEDADDDGDGVNDTSDNCPTGANPGQGDLDADGEGDACDATDDRPAINPEPETTITHTPKNPKHSHTHFSFRSSIAGSTFVCMLDNANSEPCTSPQDYRHLEPGHHVFSVVATSLKGKSDPTPATARFRVKKPSR